MKTISLSGTWQLRRFDGQHGHRGSTIAGLPELGGHTLAARVPGSVHDTLVEHGLLAEPSVGLNALAARWVEHFFWTYRRTFPCPVLEPGERVWLRCECLDLAARIFLNGREVGGHANRFRPCILEVTTALIRGENILVIEVESGLFHAMNRSAAGLGCRVDSEQGKRPWLRTIQSAFGWDWAEHLLPVGITGEVSLVVARQAHVEQVTCLAALDESLERGTVTARAWVETWEAGGVPVTLRLTCLADGATAESAPHATPGRHCLEASMDVPRPELWWPIGCGAQALHGFRIEVLHGDRVVSSDTHQVGFRHVRINQDPHPEKGRYFIVEINRRPVFLKGGNFVPIDILPSRFTAERYLRLVDEAVAANFNMLRIWGGGVYESHEFYEACDRRGILVWQEFIYACAKYPVQDPGWLAEAKAEAEFQVRRLNHHPSLVIWCGNNEMEWGMEAWNFEGGVAYTDHALFHFVLPRVLKREDGTRPYQPSSPYSLDHEHPNADHTGDQHPWTLGFGDTDFRKYRNMTCRFPNEGGFLGPTSLPTLKSALPEGQRHVRSFAWDQRDNAVSFWCGIEGGGVWVDPFSPDLMLERWLGRQIEDLSLEDYAFCGGLIHGEALSEYIRNFRRRMFDSASAVFWMYNDAWPMVRSWTIVDHSLGRTPAFHPVRRAFAPVSVAVVREGGMVRVFGLNDGAAVAADLEFGLFSFEGAYPARHQQRVTLPANAATVLAEFEAGAWDAAGVDRHAAYAVLSRDGAEIARDRLLLPLFKEIRWPEARVTIEREGGSAVFTCDTFAWRVCLDLEGRADLPDNFFDIFPGRPVRLPWPDSVPDPVIRAKGNGLFRE